jgi:hypothetical protein
MLNKSQAASAVSPRQTLTQAAGPGVRELREADAARWTDFVTRHPNANLYHTLEWRDVIKEVFGHQPVYLLAERDTGLCGILPMFLVKAPLLGSKLISLPYDIGSGGALAVDEDAERAMVERAMAVAREMRINYLELRYGSERRALTTLGLEQSEPVLITEMELDNEPSVWARVKENHRKEIRIAEKRGVVIREAESLADYQAFYEVYLKVFRGFGTPPYGSDYFPTLWRRLKPSGAARLLLACISDRCVGGLLLFCWGKSMVNKFAACLPEAVPLRTYVALYWRAIQLGLGAGYRHLSWGSSSRDQKGLIEFKERWGAETRPAVFYDLPVRRAVPSIERYYSSEGLTRRIWRKFPLSITRTAGGALNRWFC